MAPLVPEGAVVVDAHPPQSASLQPETTPEEATAQAIDRILAASFVWANKRSAIGHTEMLIAQIAGADGAPLRVFQRNGISFAEIARALRAGLLKVAYRSILASGPTSTAQDAARGPHASGTDCAACVTCPCAAAYPSVGGGRCLFCGGVAVACAARFGTPHVGNTVSGHDRSVIERLIADFMAAPPKANAPSTEDPDRSERDPGTAE